MEIQLSRIANNQFKLSFQKLRENRTLKATTSFKLLAISKAVLEKLQQYDEARQEICKKYAQRDAEGNPVLAVNPDTGFQEYQFENRGRIDFQREHFELLQEKIELPEPQIKFEDLKHVDFSVMELELFDGIVFRLDEVEDKK